MAAGPGRIEAGNLTVRRAQRRKHDEEPGRDERLSLIYQPVVAAPRRPGVGYLISQPESLRSRSRRTSRSRTIARERDHHGRPGSEINCPSRPVLATRTFRAERAAALEKELARVDEAHRGPEKRLNDVKREVCREARGRSVAASSRSGLSRRRACGRRPVRRRRSSPEEMRYIRACTTARWAPSTCFTASTASGWTVNDLPAAKMEESPRAQRHVCSADIAFCRQG